MDYCFGHGKYPGLTPEAQKQVNDASAKRSRSSSSSEKEFSNAVQTLPPASTPLAPDEQNTVQNLPPASTPPAPDKKIAFAELSHLSIRHDLPSKKWTIDLPKGTSLALADSLAQTIPRVIFSMC